MEKLAFRVLKDDLTLRRRAMADLLGKFVNVNCLTTTRNRAGEAIGLTETALLINDTVHGGIVSVNLVDIECVIVEEKT